MPPMAVTMVMPDQQQLLRTRGRDGKHWRVRERGMMAGLITNGFLLNEERIGRFNTAGLDYMQNRIDNEKPIPSGPSPIRSRTREQRNAP